VRDSCTSALAGTPHVTAGGGWLWSYQNPPESQNENLPGKWMLFPGCVDAVAAWRCIAEAASTGHIWSAKISPSASSNGHLICVYTPDFTDWAGVEAIAVRLDSLGLVHKLAYYKPDIFTYARIYNATGSRRERASIYEYQPGERCMRSTPALARARSLLASSTRSARPD